MSTTTKPMPTIGVSNYTLFPLETDDKSMGTATYKTAVSLPGTVEISPTDSGGTDNFDADNIAYIIESYIENMGHDITNADIPAEIDALMRGLDTVDGGVEVGGVITAPYFGVAWELLKADGTVRFVRYYKGVYGFASNVGGVTKPSNGASDKQTAQATYSATNRDCDDKAYYFLDSDADSVSSMTLDEIREQWFSNIDWYPSAT